jgi:hypothetical protein
MGKETNSITLPDGTVVPLTSQWLQALGVQAGATVTPQMPEEVARTLYVGNLASTVCDVYCELYVCCPLLPPSFHRISHITLTDHNRQITAILLIMWANNIL